MKFFSEKRNRYFDRTDPNERFWKYVQKTETCWIWSGGKTTGGYGKFNPTHKSGWEKSHRFSWTLHFGEIPEGKVVCHKCNMKLCVRPDHLYVATSRENTLDAMRDGLCPIGEKHGMAKITEEQVKEIRLLHKPKEISMGFLAKKYGITKTQISRIINRKTWKHI